MARGRFVIRDTFDGFLFGYCDGTFRMRVAHGIDGRAATLHSLADDLRHRLIDGTGMSFFLGDAELGQHVDDLVRGDLQLPGQLIDANFTHKKGQHTPRCR
jgi:hypothetical protein